MDLQEPNSPKSSTVTTEIHFTKPKMQACSIMQSFIDFSRQRLPWQSVTNLNKVVNEFLEHLKSENHREQSANSVILDDDDDDNDDDASQGLKCDLEDQQELVILNEEVEDELADNTSQSQEMDEESEAQLNGAHAPPSSSPNRDNSSLTRQSLTSGTSNVRRSTFQYHSFGYQSHSNSYSSWRSSSRNNMITRRTHYNNHHQSYRPFCRWCNRYGHRTRDCWHYSDDDEVNSSSVRSFSGYRYGSSSGGRNGSSRSHSLYQQRTSCRSNTTIYNFYFNNYTRGRISLPF